MNLLKTRSPKDGQITAHSRNLLKRFFQFNTYLFFTCICLIFLTISINGSKAIFTSKFPYINTAFFTEKPQTLYVYKPKWIIQKLSALEAESELIKQEDSNYETKVSTVKKEIHLLEKQLLNETIKFTEYQIQNSQEFDPNIYLRETYPFSAGGIAPALFGSIFLILGTFPIVFLMGLSSAIYLSEYSPNDKTTKIIKNSINALAGTPSIIFGVFGYGIFVLAFGWGFSLLAGWLTIALMTLPTVISDCEIALKRIPERERMNAIALGASKWQSIRHNVLPYSINEIFASTLFNIAKTSGEAAPIMFTAAYAFRDKLPWQGLENWHDFFFQGVMALPYHIYILSVKLPINAYTRDMQYGAAFIFLLFVGSLSMLGIYLKQLSINKQKPYL